MTRFAAATAAFLLLAGTAPAETYTFQGTITIEVTPPAECVVTSVTGLPATFVGPADNKGMIVAHLDFTSDKPCAAPPAVSLAAGSPFVPAGSTLPTDLKIGPSDLPAGDYMVLGEVTTADSGAVALPFSIKPALTPVEKR